MCNPQKSGASQVCITSLQITQKILSKDVFQWLELITEILSFLQIIRLRKQPLSFFNILENLQEDQQKNSISDMCLTFKSKLQITDLLTFTATSATCIYCFFLTLINVFYMFSNIHSHLSLLLFIFVFSFSPSFSYSSRHEIHPTIYNVWFDIITTCW